MHRYGGAGVAKPYRYKGILGKPRTLKLPLGFWLHPDDEEWQRKASAEAKKQDDEAINALFADCGVRRDDPFGWEKVTRTMASRHVPWFQTVVSRGPGRPPKDDWPLAQQIVNRMRDNRRLSVRAACAAIAKERRDGSTAKQLENRFYYTVRLGKAAKAEVERWLKKSRRISQAKSPG
jgi:hypothetical protein